jgi:AraC family transcriptional regulator, positive regulator of tynA and feaB
LIALHEKALGQTRPDHYIDPHEIGIAHSAEAPSCEGRNRSHGMHGVESVTRERDAASQPAATAAQACDVVFVGRGPSEAGLRQHLLPLHCGPADAVSFRCSVAIATMGESTIADLRLDASSWSRRPDELAQGRADLVQVLWQRAGRCRSHQGHHSATLEAGAWMVLDAGREYMVEFSHGARCLLMLVPRARCAGWLAAVDAMAGMAMLPNGPNGIARSILETLLRDRSPVNGRSERALHDTVVALIDDALQMELVRRKLPIPAHRTVDLAQVQVYVMDRLSDKSLCAKRVAAVFGISRRSLYNLFSPGGMTPHAFIQQAKLARAGTLLRDPDWRDAPIARIAEHCGFADAAHFSRAFHAHYGAAPTAWRARA